MSDPIRVRCYSCLRVRNWTEVVDGIVIRQAYVLGDARIYCAACVQRAIDAAAVHVEREREDSATALQKMHEWWHVEPSIGCPWCREVAA